MTQSGVNRLKSAACKECYTLAMPGKESSSYNPVDQLVHVVEDVRRTSVDATTFLASSFVHSMGSLFGF